MTRTVIFTDPSKGEISRDVTAVMFEGARPLIVDASRAAARIAAFTAATTEASLLPVGSEKVNVCVSGAETVSVKDIETRETW
jgi:hypothetical protein